MLGWFVPLLLSSVAYSPQLAADIALGARWIEFHVEGVTLVVSETELTRSQWLAVMGRLPQEQNVRCQSPDCPIGAVSPVSAMIFANRLSMLEGFDECYVVEGASGIAEDGTLGAPKSVTAITSCTGYRLPTSDEWRILVASEPLAEVEAMRDRVAWLNYSSDVAVVHPVGRKWPSEIGLFDLVGNVSEFGFDDVIHPFARELMGFDAETVETTRIQILGCSASTPPERCKQFRVADGVPYGGVIEIWGFRLLRSY